MSNNERKIATYRWLNDLAAVYRIPITCVLGTEVEMDYSSVLKGLLREEINNIAFSYVIVTSWSSETYYLFNFASSLHLFFCNSLNGICMCYTAQNSDSD